MRFSYALIVALACVACNPKSLKPNRCHTKADCALGQLCNNAYECVSKDDASTSDARDGGDGGDGADARDGGDASDASDTGPWKCTSNQSCIDRSADGGVDGGIDGGLAAGPAVCEVDAGVCVECLAPSDCAAKTYTPICQDRMCRACKTDVECGTDPGICLTNGHCATSGEVIFVESVSSGCSTANGSSAKPYCTLTEGAAALMTDRNIIVIRGAVGDRVVLATTGVSPVIIGRKNSSNIDASIPATNMTAIAVTSDAVLIRDLTVNAGTTPTSKGIVVTGSSTVATLVNVRVNLGNGVGIQADTGASLTMDRCTVTGNSKGGILVDGAGFGIKNTTITGNGPSADLTWGGIRVQNLLGTGAAQLQLLTIQTNNPSGVSCGGPISGTGVFAMGNVSGEISTTCGFSSCGPPPGPTCGAQ